ncbi:GNAT family N-acetyltransferase [Planomicrobium sp. CPCC 101079]|uniref:lipid II:glycine glycyltransferase FemX n=1 Tax=Planomicrobium sp. CPCC 101079 TaxID=2599618 RepID=UPI0011B7B4D3|nr:GNAT family N-acetyltransferase [Planomicrobium sp. CPCC 101079]TWT09229.1 GNAT family N-acetyltransferase [Planomicrobium sp. CPCC 101079]
MGRQKNISLTIVDCKNHIQWTSIVDSFLEKDIYFTYEYFKSSLAVDEGEPMLFFFENKHGKIAYPVIKRKIQTNTNLELYDITTPYGYGGPLIEVRTMESLLISEFREVFNEYCKNNRIISEFVRFHPLLNNYSGLETEMEIVHHSKTIEIPLQQEDDLLSRIPGKTRNMIRKALKNNVEVRKVEIEDHLEAFMSMYYATMDRNQASGYYYFTEEYFRETINLFGPDIHLFGAFLDEKMISSTLILTKGKYMHYHLSGSLKEYNHLGANNILLYTVAQWGDENGIARFHLGGGYSSNEDNLFKFKKSFTTSQPLQFCIGKKIHDPVFYEMLILEKEITENTGFFPLYRSLNRLTDSRPPINHLLPKQHDAD